MILDRAPKGRNERTIMDFVRRHDEYEAAKPQASARHAAKPATASIARDGQPCPAGFHRRDAAILRGQDA